jgi:hypothetical protein
MGGDTNYSVPAQPSYAQGLREALEAQTALLTGKKVGDADFRTVGKLEDLVRDYEAPLRKTTAQIDTDVLRQTLLGDMQSYDDQGRRIIGYEKGAAGEVDPTELAAWESGLEDFEPGTAVYTSMLGPIETWESHAGTHPDLVAEAIKHKDALDAYLDTRPQPPTVRSTPIYSDPDPSKIGKKYYGGGMIDLVGDSRAIKSAVKQDDYESYVRDNEENMAAFQAENERRMELGETPLTIEQWGKDHYESSGKAAGDKMPTKYVYEEEDPGRRAGFDPSGEFLGLSAFGEDIQAQNLSRQRQRDLEDVARLSPLYSDIMEEYKPGTKEALEDARDVLKAREGAFTGAGGSLSDASTLVRESYLRILGREPDDAGLASWTEALQSGASVDDMNLAFAQARATGDSGPVMEGRLQAQARALGRAASEGLDTGSAIIAPTGTAATGYDAASVAAPVALAAATGYDAASAAAIDPLAAATGYEAKANLSSGRIGGDYEATKTISEETKIPLDFENQGVMDAAMRSYRAGGGGSVKVKGVRVNNEEEFYNEMAKLAGVDVPYETYRTGYTTGMTERQSPGTRDIRAALMEDAYTGLGEGLTAREQEQIEQASRRRATALGRAFDRGSIADEVQARVLEDRNRQAQNREAAMRVLGQEAGLQTSDMSRNLQAQMQNQAALNQAAQYGVGAGLQQEQAQAQFAQQKALADQAAANRAAEYGIGAGLQQEQLGAQMAQQKAMADAQAANQAAQFGVGAGLQQQQFAAGQDIAAQAMNREAAMKASEFDILQDVARGEQNIQRELAAAESDLDRDYRQRVSQEQLAQQGTLGYIDAATRLAALEDTTTLDPFQAVLGRAGGGSLQAGQGVFGQAGYGLQSGPQYLNPESGLGFIQNQATNQANMFNAQIGADATRQAGLYNMIGSIGGKATSAALGAGGFLR